MLKLVIVAALVAVTAADSDSDPYSRAVPRSRISQQCAGYCKDSSKFSLRPDSTYVYSYEGTTISGVPGASNDTSEIKITAKAHIQVTGRPCELILQVRDARLFDSGAEGLESALRQREFAAALEESPLRFSFQDGRIEQLCPSASESTWALNVKRGLLSVFQNSMADLSSDAHLYERDVSGSCETTYSVKPMMWSDVKVLRFKNLHSCSGRGQQTLGLPGTFTASAKSVPVVRSEQFCEQTIKADDGTYLSNARCQETHVFAPFSSGQSGIRTSVAVSISLDDIIQTSEPITTDLFVNMRTNLQFDFSSAPTEDRVNEESVWSTLSQLVSQSQLGVGKSVPQLFDLLVTQLAALDDQQLVKLFDEQKEKRPRQFLLDALPLVGSAGSVKAMYQIYAAQEVTRDEIDSWLTALAFHKQPTLDMLQTLNLFVKDGFHPKAWLAVSSVVHSYCQSDAACASKSEVQAIVSHMEAMLGDSCLSTTREQQETVIVALKSIGNIGFVTSLETIKNCIMTESNSIEVRLSAIAATRRFPCNKLQQLPALQLFQDRGLDTELRIAAYLAALQCPTTATVSRLRDSLYEEDTNQVLSFVWTHLTNLQESTSSWRKEVRQMLQDSYLTHKFKTDARKFSRNYEMSLYSDVLNTGATVDSNVVFSTKSYLPRSVSLNLTLDLFGEAVNIFEVGTRLEGFETMVENLFSPKGYFPDESMQKMLKNMRNSDDEKNEVIQSFSDQFTQGTKNEPQGTMFARVFGNELYLTQFSSLNTLLNMEKANNKKYSFRHFMDSLSSLFNKKNVDYTKSFRVLNTKYVIPTVLGFPLKLELNSSATVGIQMNTEVDLNNILKTKSGNVVFSISPSAAMQIDGTMTVDAVFAKAGVETKGILNSNTYLDTTVTIDRGQIIDVFVNVPRDKVEVINVTSSVYVRHREELVEIEGVGEVLEHDSCLGEHVPTISGMRACSRITVRNASAVEDSPFFPLTGRFQYALALQKSDNFSMYQLHLKQLFESSNGKYSGKFLLEVDTPGSKLDRRLLADLSFNSKNGDANLELVSPVGSFGFTGKLALSSAEKSVDLKTQVNSKDYAAVKVALQVEHSARTIKYEPSFLLQAQPNINVNITGRLNIVPGSKYSVDLTAAGFTNTPINFSGDVSGTKGRYSASLAAKAEAVDIKVNGRLVNTPTVTSCKTLVRYILGGDSMQSVDFSAKLQNHKKGGFTKRQLLINLQMSELAEYSTKASWILYRTQKYIDSNMDLTFGKTRWKSQQLYHNNMLDKSNKNFEVVLSLEAPTKNLDYRAELQYKTSDETIHAHALAQLSKQTQFISQLDYELTYPLHSLTVELATPWKKATLDAKLESPSDSTWTQVVNGTVVIRWGELDSPQWVTATGRYKSAESLLSARHVVEVLLEGQEWEHPVQLEADWTARSADGLILSDCKLALGAGEEVYKLDVGYVRDPNEGKHDLNVNLDLPGNTYSSNVLFINNQEIKNVTVRLDLEKSLYFTSQLRLWGSVDVQLFWNYLEDRSQSVQVKYQNTAFSEMAVISMPGHYASLSVDRLGPGFSSMNITAMWGESEGSANNAILLSTFWLFDISPWYAEAMWLPTVQTRVHLITPFIGFEQQSFVFNMSGSSGVYPQLGPIIRDIDVSTKWQDQFINFQFNQISKTLYSVDYEQSEAYSTFTSKMSSSLESIRDINIKLDFKDDYMYGNDENTGKTYSVDASYNEWAVFTFNSTYTPSQLSLLLDVTNKAENEILLSGEVSVIKNSVRFKSTIPLHKEIVFTSIFDFPNNFVANLTTPFNGYEVSALKYNVEFDEENVSAKVSAEMGEEFLLFSANLGKSQSGFQGKVNLSSSSLVPDVTLMLEHQVLKSNQESSFREFVSVTLVKEGKIVQFGQALVSFADELTSTSLRTKSFQYVLALPGHYSSSNYTYQRQVKTAGVEVNHYLIHSWNKDKTELSLMYEGITSVIASLKRNGDSKLEFIFKNSGNTNFRTDIGLPGGNLLKHRLFFTGYLTWENFLMVSSPTRKVIVKNSQTLNAEMTYFQHKSTVSLDKEVAFLDLLVNLDQKSQKLDTVLFSVNTPWTHPVVAKYDLLVDTGATTKHEVQLKFKETREIKVEYDITSTELKHSASFSVYSPYCKQLGGSVSFENNESNLKISGLVNMDEKLLTSNFELIKSIENPSLSVSFKSSDRNIFHTFFNYNNQNSLRQLKFLVVYFEHEVNLQAHYSPKDNGVEASFIIHTPFLGWKEVSADFDCVLSQKYSMIAFNARKDKLYVIVSGSGTFQSNDLKTSVALEYLTEEEVQKHSTVFEYSREEESVLTSFSLNNNELSIMDYTFNCVTDINEEDVVSYLAIFKAHTPFESFRDSSVDIQFTHNNQKHVVSGSISIDNWQATIKGENTFDLSGVGHVDLKISAFDQNVELYLKHKTEENDAYSWHLLSNDAFISGSITISSSTNGNLQIQYDIDTSVAEMKNVHGTVVVETMPTLFVFVSSSNVNNNTFILNYKINFDESSVSKTEHTLWISVPIKQLENIRGTLKYEQDNSKLKYFIGEITDGKTNNKISYVSEFKTDGINCSFIIDFPSVMSFSVQRKLLSLEVFAKTNATRVIPKFLFNLSLNKTMMEIASDSSLTGNFQFTANSKDWKKLLFSAVVNNFNASATLETNNAVVSFDFESSIPDWREVSVLLKRKNVNKTNQKYSVSVSKERQELLYSAIEGFYHKLKGDGLLSVTIQKFFLDVNVKYDLTSNFSVELSYNMNGNKQHAEGQMSFSTDSTRIDLATPIQGFEDITVIGNLNKNEKKAGLVFQKNGKILDIELSATTGNNLVVLKGRVVNGKDEFMLTVGAQNGTSDEPRSSSVYINAIKNRLSLFWLSLEGSFDLEKKAGIKMSFSSLYHEQLYFEFFSLKEDEKRSVLFNYMYGIDVIYLLNSSLVGDIYRPQLVINSQFGPYTNRLDVDYDIHSIEKTATLSYKQNEDKYMKIVGKASLSVLASEVKFVIANKDILSGINGLTILSEYSFVGEPRINTFLDINGMKYFDLSLKSHSLYNIEFQSSLVSSDYINTSYDIALIYKLALPDASVVSKVLINGDYYQCTANLTWTEELANTFFQLTTNAGYGFESAVLSAKYSTDKLYNFSHLIDFFVDDSKLFHVASDISYPQKYFINLVLPDSLFLPLVKEISVGFNVTQEKKTLLFKYLSGSNEKRKLDFVIVLQEHLCSVELSRSKANDEEVFFSENFDFFYLISTDAINFHTSLKSEDSNIFFVSFHNRMPSENEKQFNTLPRLLFNIGNYYSWNVTATYNGPFTFVGTLSPVDISFNVKHPIIYQHIFGLSELSLVEKIEDSTFFKAYYKNAQFTEFDLKYSDIVNNVTYMMYNDVKVTVFEELTVTLNNKTIRANTEQKCEKHILFSGSKVCVANHYRVEVRGLSEKPLSLQYRLDILGGRVSGSVTTYKSKITFSGYAKINPRSFYCSNFNLFLNSSDVPENPFALKYETNCKDSLYASLKLFEKDELEIKADIKNNGFRFPNLKVHGKNFPVLKYCSILNELSKEDQNESAKQIFVLETSYELLKKLQISSELYTSHTSTNHFGKILIDGDKSSSELLFKTSTSDEGPVVCDISLNKDIQFNLVLNKSSDGEMLALVKLNKSGKSFEGRGNVKTNSTSLGLSVNGLLSLDKEWGEFNFVFRPAEELKAAMKITTESDNYYLDLHMYMEDELNMKTNLKYKTPFYHLGSGLVNAWLSKNLINVEDNFSVAELESVYLKEETYSVSYKQMLFGFSAITDHLTVDDVNVTISYGDSYGVLFTCKSKKISISASPYESEKYRAFVGVIDTLGFDLPSLPFLNGKNQLRAYMNKEDSKAFASLQSPMIENVLFTTESTVDIWIDDGGTMHGAKNYTTKISMGENPIFTLAIHNNNYDLLQGSLFWKWTNENIVDFKGTSKDKDLKFEVNFQNENITIVDIQLLLSIENTPTKWVKSVEVFVNKFLTVQAVQPKITIQREVHDGSITKYQLSFSSGFKSENLFYIGNCSLSLPELGTISEESETTINADILLESSLRKYAAITQLSYKPNKMDALIKWRRTVKSVMYKQDPDYVTLKFGGIILEHSAEFYLNENKFRGLLESSKTQTTVFTYVTNEKTNTNITLSARVQYSPIFLLNISHTVFDSPCTVEIKVDRRSQSLESAVTIEYNNLKQQAFINVYLDTNPQYAEFIYLDIWKQTHEASIHIGEKDDEVTLRGKINSPALDENFIIATVGHNSDKFDLNLNDVFITKAFKNETSGHLYLVLFGSEYKLQYSCETDIGIYLVSPTVNGVVLFNPKETKRKPSVQVELDVEVYHFLFQANVDNIFTVSLTKDGGNMLRSTLNIENDQEIFQLQFQCDTIEHENSLDIKHTHSPTLLVVSLNSPRFIGNNVEIVFGMKNEDPLTGVFEVKENVLLFKSYLGLSKQNKSIEVTIEAPFLSEMYKARINGIFNILESGDCEMKLSAALTSADSLLSQASFHFVRNEEVLTSGLVVKSKLEHYEDLAISFNLPLQLSRDLKANVIIQLPSIKPYELGFTLCINENSIVSSAVARWQDLLLAAEFKHGDTPFYSEMYEWNFQYSENKLQIGAWMKPKYPLTDYIYFSDLNERRIFEVSHAFILQENHFKSKLILETAFKSHEKYGIDLELQNLKVGKVVRVLGSVPQLGKDLGIDFGYSFESFLNYALLAQIRIPYANQVKMARVYSLHKILPNLNFCKLNHTLEFTDFGSIGWEFEMYGSAPFIGQGKTSAIESRLNLNSNIYSVKAKSFVQSNKMQLSFGLETPFTSLRKGDLHVSGTGQIVGSDMVVSVNSNELININITEDSTNVRQIKVLTKWRNVALKYLYKFDEDIGLVGYFCWDLFRINTSQFGVSFKTSKENKKYETGIELLLPSVLIPKLGIKTVLEKENSELFSLVLVDVPGLQLEGKLASEASLVMLKSGLQLKWTVDKNPSKNIGVFYVKEKGDEEIKHYFTLQHFALENDLMLTAYAKSTLYGLNLHYSPLKEDEVSVEFGYWLVGEGNRERSGVKIVALHPSTNTLIYGVANISSTDEYSSVGLSASYVSNMDSSNVKYIEVYGKKNKKIPEVFVGLSSNGNSFGLGGSVWEKENYLRGVTLEARVNRKDPLKLELVQNLADPGVEAELSYSLSRTYRVFAGMPNNNELTAKLSHTMYGRPNLDALATLRLNTSRILWGRFELPSMTQVGQEFYNGIVEEYADITLASQAISDGFSNFLHEDFSKKVAVLLNAMTTQADVLVSETYIEMKTIGKGFEALGNIAQRIYEEDHFYVRTCSRHLKLAVKTLYNHMSCAVEVVTRILHGLCWPVLDVAVRVLQVIHSVLSQWKMFVTEIGIGGSDPIKELSNLVADYQNLRHSLMQHAKEAVTLTRAQLTLVEKRSVELLAEAELAVNQLIRSVQQAVALQIQRLVNYTNTILAGFTVLRDTVEGMIAIVTDGIYRIKEVRHSRDWAVNCIVTVSQWFTNFRLDIYLREVDAFFDKVIKLIVSDVEKNFGEYEVHLVKAKHILAGHYEQINNIPQVHYVRSVANQIYQKMKWFWNYAKLNERLKNILKKYVENMKATLDEIEDQLDHDNRDLKSEYEYNPENNSLTFTQELPFEWRAFNQLPDYNVEASSSPFTIPAQEYSNMVQTMANYLWQDAKVLPYLLPPFGAEAFISGNNFITFDNTFYHFSGDCNSYLLASDLYHNTFSLIINYDQQNKRDLLLTTHESEILVTNSLEVFVNGKQEDLPLKLGNGNPVTLERRVNSVYIKSEEGFSLECSSFQNMCTFHLDGWYLGKTAGLLGSYNNEPSDDFLNPNQQLSENMKEFTDSWAVDSKSCESEDTVSSASSEDVRPYESMCELFFSSQSSPFLPCFDVVNPKSFYEMCLNKAKRDNTCSSVMAYLTKCTSSGVQLWMPEFCVDSSMPDATMLTGYSDIVEIPSKMAADVVFVIEEADCVDSAQLKFDSLVTSLSTELQAKGLTDNQFAFVSFNSESAQIHTMNGQIWTEDDKLVANYLSRIEDTVETPSVYGSALDLAANLPFHPGASKSVILIHCSSCSHNEDYTGVLQKFTQNDITLHILQKENIMGKKGKVVSKAIGLELSGAYPRKRLAKNALPSSQLLHQVSIPQDLCMPIMLVTKGTLFNLDVTRKGLRAWSSRVAQGAVPPTTWKQCENTVGADNVPMWKCRSTSQNTKLKDWDQSALDEYMDTSPGSELYTEYEEVDR